MAKTDLSLQDIYQARRAIAGHVVRSPLVRSQTLSTRTGADVFLKLETTQPTGSFKIRGATNRLAHLDGAARQRGVVTTSSGNHGPAVAHAATTQGVGSVICLYSTVPSNKVQNVRDHGGEVRIVGDSFDEAMVESERLVREEGMTLVHAFDDRYVAAGAGTIGLELLEDLPELDSVLVPLSGGGLLGGVALALKSAAPHVRVIGVSMARGAAMYESQKAGRPIQVEELSTLADALGGGIGLDNRFTFQLVRDYVDDMLLLSEEQIAAAMRHAFDQERLVVEGAGAVGIGAILADVAGDLGRTVAVVVSGRNVDMNRFRAIVAAPA